MEEKLLELEILYIKNYPNFVEEDRNVIRETIKLMNIKLGQKRGK